MRSPTLRQLQALRFIADFARTEGFPPSMRDIGAELGITSSNGVSDHLKALERKGLVTRKKMAARSLVITEAGWRVLYPPKPALISGSEVAS